MRAIVTGGASGIGRATAELLSERGFRVAVLDVAGSSESEGVAAFPCDVADDASVRSAVAAAVDGLGGLDVLVNNAGIGLQGTVEENDDDQWRQLLEVNVLGIVRVSRAALPALRQSEHAAIVNTCSAAALVGLPRRAAYCASKGAVLALTRAMAADHLAEGIRVNCVNPGTADTPWIGRLLDAADDPAAERAALVARQPHGRLVSPREVAEAIAYLASPGAGSTTGISIDVDGGLTAVRLPSGVRP